MGTYNYASSSKMSNLHTKYDVETYIRYGNTLLDPTPNNDEANKNVKDKRPADKNNPTKIDDGAQNHYIYICLKIGINYEKLIQKNFSDKCY